MTGTWPNDCEAPLDLGDGPDRVTPPRTWFGASEPAPATPIAGDRWVNTADGTVKIWDGAAWSPEGGG